jgi:tripartite-type tricarboxylate transporter receptor subunit TctC
VSWNGLFAPTGTPKEIIDRLAAEFQRAVKDPQFSEVLVKQGVTPTSMTPEQFAAFLKEDMAFWAEAVKIAGVTLKQ